MKIICLSFCNGKKHDFKLFKESDVHAGENTEFETDTGYIGITAIHPNSLLPKKRSKNHPLTKEERRNNRIISGKRIYVEYAIRFIYQYVKHGHVLQFDGLQTKAVYSLTDSLMKNNLKGTIPQQQEMERELKAIIQQYMERMTQDRLLPD